MKQVCLFLSFHFILQPEGKSTHSSLQNEACLLGKCSPSCWGWSFRRGIQRATINKEVTPISQSHLLNQWVPESMSMHVGRGTDFKARLPSQAFCSYLLKARLAENKKAIFSSLLPRTSTFQPHKEETAQPAKLTWKIPIRSAAKEPQRHSYFHHQGLCKHSQVIWLCTTWNNE